MPSASRLAISSSTGPPALPAFTAAATAAAPRRALETVFAGDACVPRRCRRAAGTRGRPSARCDGSRCTWHAGDRHPADLAGRAGEAPMQLAAEHDRETDAPADPEQHEVVDALRGAAVRLGDRDEVDVVFERDRDARGLRAAPRAGHAASGAGRTRRRGRRCSDRRGRACRARRDARSAAARSPVFAASITARCTTPTGSSVSFVDSSIRLCTVPRMSAQAATTCSGPTSTPTT